MKNFEHIKLQLAYGENLNELAGNLATWKTIVLSDGTKVMYSKNLLDWESRQSQGI